MDRSALRHNLATVARVLGVSAAGSVALTTAIWLPTLALQRFAGWPFLDAYLMGCPAGFIMLALAGIGVMSYRQKARQL